MICKKKKKIIEKKEEKWGENLNEKKDEMKRNL